MRELEPLDPGDEVWISNRGSKGVVEGEVQERSYEVTSRDGTFRSNRKDLIRLPSETSTSASDDVGDQEPTSKQSEEETACTEPRVRRSARVSRPPDRLDPS